MACVVCWKQMLLKSSLKYLGKRLGNFAKESTFCIFGFRIIECFATTEFAYLLICILNRGCGYEFFIHTAFNLKNQYS